MTTTLDLGELSLSKEQIEKADLYAHLLLEWNQKIRLTGYESLADIRTHLLFESLLAFSRINAEIPRPMIDFGSGNGTPGLLFALFDPSLQILLLERIEKKQTFLEYAASRLSLPNVRVRSFLDAPVVNPVIVMKAITLQDLFKDPYVKRFAAPPWSIFRFGQDAHPSCFPVSSYVINGSIQTWGISGSIILTESVSQG